MVWVWSTLLTLRQQASRARRIAAAVEELEQLRRRLASAKARLRGAAEIDQQVKPTVEKFNVQRYVEVRRVVVEAHVFKQTRRGRPGPDTAYRKITKRRFDLHHPIVQEAIDYDRKSDGMYPLLTNDRRLGAAQVLQAHKGQPMIEKRFEQLKTVHKIAPVLLKDEERIEALFTLYAIALLVQALIERELRRAMAHDHIGELPLYPPTTCDTAYFGARDHLHHPIRRCDHQGRNLGDQPVVIVVRSRTLRGWVSVPIQVVLRHVSNVITRRSRSAPVQCEGLCRQAVDFALCNDSHGINRACDRQRAISLGEGAPQFIQRLPNSVVTMTAGMLNLGIVQDEL